MSSSLPAGPSELSNQFYDTMEITTLTTMQLESASKKQRHAEDAVYGLDQEDMKIVS